MRGTSAKDLFIRKCLSVKTRGFFPTNKHHLEVMFTIVMCPRCLFFFFFLRLYNSKCTWLYYCKLYWHLGKLLQIWNPKVKAHLDDYVWMYSHTALLVLILATISWIVNPDISHSSTGTCSPFVAIADMEFYKSALSIHWWASPFTSKSLTLHPEFTGSETAGDLARGVLIWAQHP